MKKLTHVLLGSMAVHGGQAHEPPDARSALVASKSSGGAWELGKALAASSNTDGQGRSYVHPKVIKAGTPDRSSRSQLGVGCHRFITLFPCKNQWPSSR